MIKRKTLLIVGAGASHDFGLPLGAGLSRAIADACKIREKSYNERIYKVTLDELVSAHCNKRGVSNTPFIAASQKITEGVQQAGSIDEFMSRHCDDEFVSLLGKMAIQILIMQAEKESTLFIKDGRPERWLDRFSDTWLYKFASMLFTGQTVKTVKDVFKNVSIICFNYDRCIEHFLFHAVQVSFAVDAGRAKDVLSELEIVHPYGVLGGGLPPISGHLAFGEDFSPGRFLDGWEHIRTFNESVDSEVQAKLHQMIQEPQAIVFLGFGFLGQNMDLLTPDLPATSNAPPESFATIFGVREPNVYPIRRRILKLRVPPDKRNAMRDSDLANMKMHAGTCADLLDEYELLLKG